MFLSKEFIGIYYSHALEYPRSNKYKSLGICFSVPDFATNQDFVGSEQ